MLFTTHLTVTLLVAGMMWFVQVVHYPLMRHVGITSFVSYETAHTRRAIGLVVSAMALELVTGVLLLRFPPPGISLRQIWLGVGTLGVIWLATFVLQVPQHRILARGFDARAYRRLVTSNWIRTLAYSVRGGLVLWMLGSLVR